MNERTSDLGGSESGRGGVGGGKWVGPLTDVEY